jgi:hypothetical protein
MAFEKPRSALFKYEANPHDPDLRDKSFCDSICSENPDPDFWSNAPLAVWAICGPYQRAALSKGDMILFIPQKYSLEQAGFRDYIFAGFLVVREIHSSPQEVKADSRISKRYYRRYRSDLRMHLRNDAPLTGRIRPHNFVVGTSDSKWFGREGPPVRPILGKLGLHAHLRSLGRGRNNSIPRLTKRQATRIREEILSYTKAKRSSPKSQEVY